MEPRDIIVAEYGGHSRNFMTPSVIRTMFIVPDKMAAELSCGVGLEPNTSIVGVTVASIDENGNTKREIDLSTSFSASHYPAALALAEAYIEQLKRERGKHE